LDVASRSSAVMMRKAMRASFCSKLIGVAVLTVRAETAGRIAQVQFNLCGAFLRRGLDRNCKVVEVAVVALEQPPDSVERSDGFS
jgi:hypothetical protein